MEYFLKKFPSLFDVYEVSCHIKRQGNFFLIRYPADSGLLFTELFVKVRIVGVEIFLVQIILHQPETFAKTLEMH